MGVTRWQKDIFCHKLCVKPGGQFQIRLEKRGQHLWRAAGVQPGHIVRPEIGRCGQSRRSSGCGQRQFGHGWRSEKGGEGLGELASVHVWAYGMCGGQLRVVRNKNRNFVNKSRLTGFSQVGFCTETVGYWSAFRRVKGAFRFVYQSSLNIADALVNGIGSVGGLRTWHG